MLQLLLLMMGSSQAAAAQALPVVTWVSAGEQPGQAILVGVSVVTGWAHISHGQLTALPGLPAGGQHRAPSVVLSVLQQGNGTVALALPKGLTLGHWGLALCMSDSICTPTLPLYAPDVMWASCSGVACAAGETLRLFGRRLAFDAKGCRKYNSTEPISGAETHVRLTAAGAEAAVEVEAVTQSCWEARFKLPATLLPGTYKLEVATHLGGRLGPYTAPTQTDVHRLVISPEATRGVIVFQPNARTGSAIVSALAAAAAHPGGGIVQLSAGVYTLEASTTLAVCEGCTLRGAGMSETILKFGKQTIGTAQARQHMALIHGANTSHFWALEDLAIEAPMSDHMNHYSGSPVVADCGLAALALNKYGLRDDENSWACAGMSVSRVKITIDKTCAPGTAWPAQKDFLKSCGGYTAINSTEKGNSMLAGVVPAVMITGRDAVLQDSEITHYGTCGSNVAFAVLVQSAANVAVHRNTITYGCAPYGFAAVDGLVFEGNSLVPYKGASGGGANIDTFGNKGQMRRLLYANNTQRLTPGVASHLETMTLDGGAGAYEGEVSVTDNGQKLTTAGQPQFAFPPGSQWRAEWSVASALLLEGPGAGQWRRALLDGASNNDTYTLERPFEVAPARKTFAVIGKLEGQLLFVGNTWARSHFQLYAMCLDCVVAENLFDGCFAADWGRNPHALVGGWQPNFQVEWVLNTVVGGTGISFMTSDQPLTCTPGLANKYRCPPGSKINASYGGPLNNRIVLRGNVFEGGSGIQLAVESAQAQTNANVLVDSNLLQGTCNLTTRPMPTGADINDYLQCTVNGTCRLHDIVLHGNELSAVRSCGHQGG
eukprot:COSAG03_NODE_17_length_21787_cov_46.088436_9_plen_829_part_00